VDGIVAGLECVPGRTVLLLETTAGSGTSLGASFEEMATLLDRVPRELQHRVAVCADTAHLFAAGYDLAGDFDAVWARFDDLIGLHRLRMLHLNDSKVALGSRRDRHELIGEGAIGAGAFRRIMTDHRFAGVPKVIETPKLDDAETTDRRMLELLRSFALGAEPPARADPQPRAALLGDAVIGTAAREATASAGRAEMPSRTTVRAVRRSRQDTPR
jgi:deoxyribonuclease-4